MSAVDAAELEQSSRVFQYYDYLNTENKTDKDLNQLLSESLSQTQRHMLHNMRSDLVSIKLNLDPESSDFKAVWHLLSGQVQILTTILGE